MRKLLIAALALCAPALAWAGIVPPDSTIFPGQTGTQLISSLVTAYKSTTNLGYDAGRDMMYGTIDKQNDSLECVYSGYRIWMDPSADPSTWAYSNDINCEHSWPQSLLSSSTAEADLHHLFPTEIQVNGDRGNYPFGDIPDAQTTYWYRNNNRTTSIPTSDIDQYAEYLSSTRFEPREVQKGNTARAMYYVLTMWQLGDTDLTWWTGQKNDLYAWHVNDPADVREIARTKAIAPHQQNKANPFVLDSTLIRRAFFPGSGVEGSPGVDETTTALAQNSPNPFRAMTAISYSLSKPATVRLGVYDALGRAVYGTRPCMETAGAHAINWNGRALPQGVYFYRLTVDNEIVATRRMVLLR